jgi:hypothetical protein
MSEGLAKEWASDGFADALHGDQHANYGDSRSSKTYCGFLAAYRLWSRLHVAFHASFEFASDDMLRL